MTKVIKTISNDILVENICFIPTMGSLHDGHLSLVDLGKKTNLKTLVSIFLNRRQFNDIKDFENYPNPLDSDVQKLYDRGVDYIFVPEEDYIYPSSGIETVSPNEIGRVLEGYSRPGHFEGVLTVVKRLFDLIQPSYSVFGKKDAQQLFLIKNMIREFDLNIQIIEGDIIRDKNGLALSSRNNHLSSNAKLNASCIFDTLIKAAESIYSIKDYEEAIKEGSRNFVKNEIVLDYLELVDTENFKSPNKYSKKLKLLIAAYVENIRLIDNIDIEICKKIIAIDIGNTETTVGIGNKVGWDSYRFTTRDANTSDELLALFNSTFNLDFDTKNQISGSIICSVVPQVTNNMFQAVEKYLESAPIVVGPGIKTGLKVNIDNPKELAPDRIANSVAVYKRAKSDVLIVDLGTATTFDVVNEKKEYLGGAIAPGIRISLDALTSKTASLKSVELDLPKKVVGKNTYEAIQSGLIYGHASMIDSMIEKLLQELGTIPKIIITGGLSKTIQPALNLSAEYEEDLTLIGLEEIYNLNN